MPEIQTIYNAPEHRKCPKAIAFDLDETLGTFADLYLLWVKLKPEFHTQSGFNELLDLYPEFLRVGILHILSFLRDQIVAGKCLPIYIYTNNQCEFPLWIEYILSYFDKKVSADSSLFARPVRAYKISNRRVEPNRTSHDKTYRDFVSCSLLHDSTHELCFIDDQDHHRMKHGKVYFIQPPPYHHRLSYELIVGRFVSSELYRRLGATDALICGGMSFVSSTSSSAPHLKPFFREDPATWLNNEHAITQKIMYYVREFFFMTLRRKMTRRRRPNTIKSKYSRRKTI